MKGVKDKDCNIDAGLAISGSSTLWNNLPLSEREVATRICPPLRYGVCRTQEQLAAFCNCTKTAIQRYENKGLRKMRKYIYRHPEVGEAFKELLAILHNGNGNGSSLLH